MIDLNFIHPVRRLGIACRALTNEGMGYGTIAISLRAAGGTNITLISGARNPRLHGCRVAHM